MSLIVQRSYHSVVGFTALSVILDIVTVDSGQSFTRYLNGNILAQYCC